MTMLPESISLNPESSIFPPRLTLSSVMCAQSQAMAGVLSYERGQKQDCHGAQPVYEDSSRLVIAQHLSYSFEAIECSPPPCLTRLVYLNSFGLRVYGKVYWALCERGLWQTPCGSSLRLLFLQWLKQALLHEVILKCLRRGLTHIRARPSLVNRSNINNITIWKNGCGCLTCDPSRKRSNVSRFCRVINRVWNLEQRFFNRPQPK